MFCMYEKYLFFEKNLCDEQSLENNIQNIPRDAIVTQVPRTQTGLELNKKIIDEYRDIKAAWYIVVGYQLR